ncbi:MAG TPA: TRAM domain-containing protein, partial [Spongiibacteraceae bacterium]
MSKRKNSGPLFFKPARANENEPGKSIELQVSIDRLSAEGRGLAYRDSKPLFIANALPGETVRVRITSDKRDYAEAELIEIVTPATQRIAPRCELFGRCGGCQLQMLDDRAQLQHKAATLQHLLQPYFAQSLSDPISAAPWHYRHRARLAVTEHNGKPLLGFKALNSHRVIAVAACATLDIRLQPLLQQLPQWLAQLTHWRRIDEIRIAIDSAGVVALACHTQRDLPAADLKLLNDCCDAANIRYAKEIALTYAVPSQDTAFQFTVDDFTQVNPAINDQL